MIELVCRCSWTLWSSEFGYTLGNHDGVRLDKYLEAVIERVWRYSLWGCDHMSLGMCTCRPWSCELQGHNRASLEMHKEAMIVQSWRPWSSESGDTLGGRDWVSSEMHLEAVIERVWIWTWRPWSSKIGRVLGGGRRTARLVLRLYSSASWLATVGMWHGDFTLELSWRAGWWRLIM